MIRTKEFRTRDIKGSEEFINQLVEIIEEINMDY